ncbi:MAG TPA: HupE/UreJ family protein [Steroidobacteraceae bacterium]|nr:HupE/UreJ family protein [Steroidobacteraceae bacterium]
MKQQRRASLAGVLAVVLAAWVAAAHAHKPSDSYLTLTVPASGSVLDGQWDIALRDLDFVLGLDANNDGAITWGELKAARTRVADYAFSRLAIEGIGRGDRSTCPAQLTGLLVDEHVDGHYVVLRFNADCGLRPTEVAVHYRLLFEVDPTHRGLLQVVGAGGEQAAVLSREAPRASLNVSSPERWQQLGAFVCEGIWHILKGYDHILFLLTLLFPAVVRYGVHGWEPRASLRDAALEVLQVVTAFTLAHSLTLSLAVLGLVHLPARWVESAIALTVLLGALNNLKPLIVRRRWAVAFTFGLVHGLGFASVLTDLGLHGANLTLSLLGFNVGVEMGQMLIVLAVLPLAFLLRDTALYRRTFMPAGSAAIVLLAGYWLVVRMTGTGFG